MDIVSRKKISMLIRLAEADHHFAPQERELIEQEAARRNLDSRELETLLRNPDSVDALGALSPNQKFDYLLSCIRLMFADGRVLESEVRFCIHVAIRLGFRKSVVDFLTGNFQVMESAELKTRALAEYA
jgi:hypothetical protein